MSPILATRKKLKLAIINSLLFITAQLRRSESLIYSIFIKKANRPISLSSPRPNVERTKNQYVKKPGDNATPAAPSFPDTTYLQLQNLVGSATNLESEDFKLCQVCDEFICQCKEEFLGQDKLQPSFLCGLNFNLKQIFAKK